MSGSASAPDTNATLIFSVPVPSTFAILVESFTILVVGALLLVAEPVAVPTAGVVLGLLAYVLQRRFLRRIVALGAATREHETGMMQWATQSLGGVKGIQVLGKQSDFVDRFTDEVRANAQATAQYRVTALVPRYVLERLGVAGLVVVSGVVLLRGEPRERLLRLLGVLAVAVVRLLPSAARIMSALTDVRYYSTAATHLAHELDAQASRAPAAASAPRERLRFRERVRLVGVGLRYPGSAEPALRDLNLEIRRAESAGLVGPSGAGKTTLADVLIGLLAVTEGRFEVDGIAIDDSTRTRW